MRIALFVAGMLLAASLLSPLIMAQHVANLDVGAWLTTGKPPQPILVEAPAPAK